MPEGWNFFLEIFEEVYFSQAALCDHPACEIPGQAKNRTLAPKPEEIFVLGRCIKGKSGNQNKPKPDNFLPVFDLDPGAANFHLRILEVDSS